ncbi:hypothetical protein EDD16DRAFT_1707826 [Pisolithus croceorrhizus]|nr:hypothetical protein EDD16DRAFT_1707826 [Pisolithus croceorrhizus]
MADAIPPNIYLTLINMQSGTYGLSYDVSTPATENDLPHGWNSRRVETYRQIALCLECGHFACLQKSDWVHKNINTITTYYMMLILWTILPPGKLQSMVKGLKMHSTIPVIGCLMTCLTADIKVLVLHAQQETAD